MPRAGSDDHAGLQEVPDIVGVARMLGFLFDSTGRLAAEVSTLSQPKSLLASHGVTVDGVAHQGQWAEYRDACVASVGNILVDVQRTIPKSEFCGVGLLVCRDTSALPMCPLSGERTVRDTANVVDAICSASMLSHPQHDGFHILSPSLALTHTNQYIAPPVPPDFFPVCPTPGFGARHMSALLASWLPAVICAAVLNTRNRILIFADGGLRAHFVP